MSSVGGWPCNLRSKKKKTQPQNRTFQQQKKNDHSRRARRLPATRPLSAPSDSPAHVRLDERQRQRDVMRKARRSTADDCLRWQQHKHGAYAGVGSPSSTPSRAAATVLKSRIASQSASSKSRRGDPLKRRQRAGGPTPRRARRPTPIAHSSAHASDVPAV